MVFNTFGGDKRDRTADLLNAIQALSQLSYTPKCALPSSARLFYQIFSENATPFFKKEKLFSAAGHLAAKQWVF